MKNTSNETLNEYIQNITEYFNEEDSSVGLYATGKIDNGVVRDLRESFNLRVTTYSDNKVAIQVAPTDTIGIKIYLNEDGVWVGKIVKLLDEIFESDTWKEIEKEL